jgi:tetratricopeptide (TPR) repeat protein
MYNLGSALRLAGRYAEALRVLERAHELAPQHLGTKTNLARLLATCPEDALRDGPRALRLARSVGEQTQYRSAQALDLLACAQAAAGQYAEARESARQAIRLAEQNGRRDWVEEFKRHLRAFDVNRPFREQPVTPADERE